MVFNPISGQTHYLDIVTGRVLNRLMSGSSSRGQFRQEIAAFLEVDNDDQIAEMATKILDDLEEAGLVEPAD